MIHCEFIALDILRYKSFIIYFYKTCYTDKKYTLHPFLYLNVLELNFFYKSIDDFVYLPDS